MAEIFKVKPNIKRLPPRLPAKTFWGLLALVYFSLQLPYARIPVLFLSTLAHEFGHGFGAMITGGRFDSLIVYPNFSGVAQTATASDFSRFMVIVMGLLGPSLVGALLLILTRACHWYRFSIAALGFLFLVCLIWAGDLFTVGTLLIGAGLLGTMAWKLPHNAAIYAAHIIAFSLCLTALTGFGYFFMGNANVSGELYRSDTGQLADILGGPHWLWGGLLVAVSIAILVLALWVSDKWARQRAARKPHAF